MRGPLGKNFSPSTPPWERLLSRRFIDNNGCWIWTGAKGRTGYGLIGFKKEMKRVHRFAYEIFIGPIAKSLTIDHLCRNRACFNPRHLEACTLRENIRRGVNYRSPHTCPDLDKCPNGHQWTKSTILYRPNKPTIRECRECVRASDRKYKQQKRKEKQMKVAALLFLFSLAAPCWAQESAQDREFNSWYNSGGYLRSGDYVGSGRVQTPVDELMQQTQEGEPVPLSPVQRFNLLKQQVDRIENALARVNARLDVISFSRASSQPQTVYVTPTPPQAQPPSGWNDSTAEKLKQGWHYMRHGNEVTLDPPSPGDNIDPGGHH